jgi:hypothetical protein
LFGTYIFNSPSCPPADAQQVFDFVLYKIEKAPTPYISQELAKDYTEMIERLKADMEKRKGQK